MSKKIDSALKDLLKALKKHADVASTKPVSLKKSQRATARVQAAATHYAEVVHAKSGLPNPFNDMIQPGLEDSTLASLAAERDAIKLHLTGPIATQKQAAL
jgi:hypothetical protein